MEVKLCIDTNIYALLKKGDDDVVEVLEKADEILVPVVVIGELYAGFYQGKKQRQNIKELNDFLEKPGVSVVPIDSEIAERYGAIVNELRKKGTPIPTNDIWIAATVLQMGAKLFTKDKHFTMVPGLLLLS